MVVSGLAWHLRGVIGKHSWTVALCAVCLLGGASLGTLIPALAANPVQELRSAYLAVTAEVDLPTPVDPNRIREAEITWDISNLEHARVGYWIGQFQNGLRGNFERFIERKGRYAPLIITALDERSMPRDLIYLAMIESGFNPLAYSRARASGMWQFVRETGVRYGLDVNSSVDERNDPVKATQAALDYLSDLHKRFGSWYLAAAAYNTGENRVGRIMRQMRGTERGTDADYYAIWPNLPRETRDYVPMMIAAARISKEPAAYGFDYVRPLDPWSFDEVVAEPGTPLTMLAQEAGTTVSDLKSLNPQLKTDRTRRDEQTTIRVPTLVARSDSGAGQSVVAAPVP